MKGIWFYLSLFMFMLSLLVFILNSAHILSSLILLEYMILSLYLSVITTHSAIMSDALLIVTLFTISATAAATGLSLLIPLTRSHGQDYFSSFNILW